MLVLGRGKLISEAGRPASNELVSQAPTRALPTDTSGRKPKQESNQVVSGIALVRRRAGSISVCIGSGRATLTDRVNVHSRSSFRRSW